MNVAFIPVRGGSKSIPLKNIKEIAGAPLVYWTVRAACKCAQIDVVYVATDSAEIKAIVESFQTGAQDDLFAKVQVIGRSAESASDIASTEFAMIEFANQYEFDNIALIQATSPMLTGEDLDGGFALFNSPETDSVLSVVKQYRFLWETSADGSATPQNYDVFARPRRQDFSGYLMENGAFYITSRADLLQYNNRVSGNIKVYEMNEDSSFEIDEPSDWLIIEALMHKNGFVYQRLVPEIKMFLTDCDGCLTDAGMYYSEKGDELKKFNTRDGMAFAMLRQKGIITGIVTAETVDLNRRRAEKMKLDILERGCKNKVETITALCGTYGILLENVVYIGDDINDIEALKAVGFSACPADAMPSVKAVVQYIATAKGGEGVIREVFEHFCNETIN